MVREGSRLGAEHPATRCIPVGGRRRNAPRCGALRRLVGGSVRAVPEVAQHSPTHTQNEAAANVRLRTQCSVRPRCNMNTCEVPDELHSDADEPERSGPAGRHEAVPSTWHPPPHNSFLRGLTPRRSCCTDCKNVGKPSTVLRRRTRVTASTGVPSGVDTLSLEGPATILMVDNHLHQCRWKRAKVSGRQDAVGHTCGVSVKAIASIMLHLMPKL